MMSSVCKVNILFNLYTIDNRLNAQGLEGGTTLGCKQKEASESRCMLAILMQNVCLPYQKESGVDTTAHHESDEVQQSYIEAKAGDQIGLAARYGMKD